MNTNTTVLYQTKYRYIVLTPHQGSNQCIQKFCMILYDDQNGHHGDILNCNIKHVIFQQTGLHPKFLHVRIHRTAPTFEYITYHVILVVTSWLVVTINFFALCRQSYKINKVGNNININNKESFFEY